MRSTFSSLLVVGLVGLAGVKASPAGHHHMHPDSKPDLPGGYNWCEKFNPNAIAQDSSVQLNCQPVAGQGFQCLPKSGNAFNATIVSGYNRGNADFGPIQQIFLTNTEAEGTKPDEIKVYTFFTGSQHIGLKLNGYGICEYQAKDGEFGSFTAKSGVVVSDMSV